MGFLLLTGATGLLGRYFVRDLLLARQPLAVLVRRTKLASARASRRAPASLGCRDRTLPAATCGFGRGRFAPGLGLNSEDSAWLGRNCAAVIHHAASLTYYDTAGEPERTNLHGTQHVLDVCRTQGIRNFVHVSTAYVCGARTGRVLESELDVGQSCNTDYERTKLAAETLVRSAPFLDNATVLRPSIVVGDSKTGHTSTFHGFYAPLKAMFALGGSVGFVRPATPYYAQLGLNGADRKNLVPVDWVSAVSTHIATHAEFRGATYHLTHTRPASFQAIENAMLEAAEGYLQPADSRRANRPTPPRIPTRLNRYASISECTVPTSATIRNLIRRIWLHCSTGSLCRR